VSERGLQVRVGALVLVALVLLAAFVLVLGRFSVGAQRTFYIELADSGSLLKGAPVKIAGVRAGRVEQVEFLAARDARRSEVKPGEAPVVNVRLRIAIDEAMAGAVRTDSDFFITTQGVLGEKYLEIVPGSSQAAEWPDGAFIRAHDPARLDLLFSRASAILDKVEQALSGVDGAQVGALLQNVTRLTGHIDEAVVANRAHIDMVASNAAVASGDIAQLARALREGVGSSARVDEIVGNVRQVSDTLATNAGPIVDTARRTLERVDVTVATVGGLVEKHRDGLDVALGQLGPIATDARSATRDAAAVAQGITLGRGTVGQLLVDQEIYDDLKEMLRDLKRHPWKMLWKE